MTPTKTFEIGRHRLSGGVRTGCLRIIDVMEMSIFNNRYSVVLVARLGRCRAIMAHPKLLVPLSPDRKHGMGHLRMLHWNAKGTKSSKFF